MDNPSKSQNHVFRETDSRFRGNDTALRQVGVLLPVNLDHTFDYLAPADVEEGTYVTVPFGRMTELGVIWSLAHSDVPREKCKPVKSIHSHVPPMNAGMRQFISWAANYTCASLGNVLKLALSEPEAITREFTELYYSLGENAEGKSDAQKRILETLKQCKELSGAALKEKANVDTSIISRLVKKGALIAAEKRQVTTPPKLRAEQIALSKEQKTASESVLSSLDKGFSVHVLDGVTGSGKTEVYFEAIEHILKQGKQVLVLLPEIALSVQWLARFEKRFGFPAAIWHSAVRDASRLHTWQGVARGELPLVVGARSALFLPYRNLGLIVVDEEHDTSYKQEEGVIYNARDMAVVRASLNKLPVILASATPSLETIVNCEQKKYTCHTLRRRYSETEMPEVGLIDLRAEKMPATQWISKPLEEAIVKTLDARKQTLLFLNRRGYAPLLLCRKCGHRFECPECTAWLVLHRNYHKLECHHCGYREQAPNECPRCGAEEEMLAPCGPGIERLAEEVLGKFPDSHLLVLSSETLEKAGEIERAIASIASGEADIIIGTQLLAKGHHFPSLNLVGIVDADFGLQGSDLRAAERTYQLLHQLSGRAGREGARGKVLLQTTAPEHPVMKALLADDRDGLYAIEKKIREHSGLPPYGRLAAIILEGKNETAVEHAGQALARAIPRHPEIRVFGPARAPMYKLRSRYRLRFLLKSPKQTLMQNYILDWLHAAQLPKSVKAKIDIDPISFY